MYSVYNIGENDITTMLVSVSYYKHYTTALSFSKSMLDIDAISEWVTCFNCDCVNKAPIEF